MKRIYIRIYSYSSLQDEIDVTHLSLNKIVSLIGDLFVLRKIYKEKNKIKDD